MGASFDPSPDLHTLGAPAKYSAQPGSLKTWTEPRGALTIWSIIASPTPVPLKLPCTAALPRTNFLKMSFRSDAGGALTKIDRQANESGPGFGTVKPN